VAARERPTQEFSASINPISRLIPRPEFARSLRHKTVRVLQLWEQKGYGPPVIRLGGLALQSAKVKAVPYIPMHAESKARTGFLTDEEYVALARECSKEGLWLRSLLTVAYNFAFRKGELLELRVRQVDLLSRTIRLEAGTTKNGEGRNVKMTDNVLTLLTACTAGKQKNDHVFTRENGKPIKSFRGVWETVCKRAGVPELLFHDLRRTGVRNLRRLGVAESVAMTISGHKTREVFDRYNIIDEADIADVATRLDEKQKSKAPEVFPPLGQTFGHDCTKTETVGTAPSLALLPN
jgi:integrase